MKTRLVAGIAAVALALGSGLVAAAPASALSNPTIPWLTLDHTISSQPWPGSSTKAFDLEGMALMPFENMVIVADDSGDRVYVLDRTTGALLDTIPQSAFAAAPPVGGGAVAGAARADAFRGVAYDIVSGDLYVFSGACCGTVGPYFPTAFRLHRDASQKFKVLSYQPLPEGTDPVAATYRAGSGIYFGKGTKIRTYDYASNTIGADIKLIGTGTAIQGIAFDGSNLLVTNTDDQLVKVATSDWTAVGGWTLGLAPFGIGVPRSFVLSGDQFLIADGDDTHLSTDVNRYRLVAVNLGPAPPVTAAFTPHVTRGPAPLGVWFFDHSVRADTHAWNFGDGATSTEISPPHTFANPGTYTVTLHVTGVGGASDASTLITVLPADTLSGGYTLDGFGGLHPFYTGTGALPPITRGGGYWPGWDIARGVATTADGHGGYVLDGYGGLHPFRVGNGAAPPATTGGPYWSGWDAARGVALTPDGKGGLVVDLAGGIHRFRIGAGSLPPKPVGGPYWAGQDRARGISILPDGSGGFVVDRDGGLFAFSLGSGPAPTAPTGVWNAPVGQEVQGVALASSGRGGYTLDGNGGLHRFSVVAKPPIPGGNATWPGWNIARDVALLPAT